MGLANFFSDNNRRLIKQLMLLGCVHLGAKNHAKEELKRYFDYAKKYPREVSLAFLGDLFDTGVPVGTRHIGSVFDNNLTPQEQVDTFVKMATPVAKQIEAIVKGNHEKRVEDTTSVELLKGAADQLKVPYKGSSGILVWEGKKIFIAHGSSSGPMTDFNKIIAAYEGLDAIVLAHTHQLYSQKLRRFKVNAQGNVEEKGMHLVRVGSFLKDAAYARFALHPPTPIGAPIMELNKEGELSVQLGL